MDVTELRARQAPLKQRFRDDVRLRADAVYDARGTLGLDREVPVGVQDVVVTVEVATDADDAALARLVELTERFCVVAQSLRDTPRFAIRRV